MPTDLSLAKIIAVTQCYSSEASRLEFWRMTGIKSEWREARREFREVRNDLKAALCEKFDAPPEERKRVFAILRRAIDEIRSK